MEDTKKELKQGTPVKNKEETPKKKKNVLFILFLVLALGFGGFKIWNLVRPLSSYKNDGNDRSFIYIDLEAEKAKVDAAVEAGGIGEINGGPYSQKGIGGGTSVYVSGPSSVGIKDLIENGKAASSFNGWSLRTIEDEVVSGNESYNFNQYVSYRKCLDNIGDTKLTKEEVNSYAEKLKSLAQSEEHPSWLYIDELVNNLEDKEPTKASIIYLALANGLSNEGVANVFEINLGNINDYLSLLDRSYKIEQEQGLTVTYTGNLEIVDEDTAIIHSNSESPYTYWAIIDATNFWSGYYPTDKSLEDDIVIGIEHYKNVSNDFIAEYFIMSLNKNASDEGIKRSWFTKSKPCFTWCISPKIEEIASAYYDIVEPAVYAGTYTNFADSYQKTYDALEGKYTLEEIESAVTTYEFWALCNYN